LGGYSRHRKTFHYATPPLSPWSALIEELQTDISRISSRNLGRDDRIISFHGKEARYPFLASNVIDLLTKTPIWLKCDHRFGEGVGDKILLREMANTLGLEGASGLKKRAIHFGSRTAKMELDSGKAKGEDDFVL
jgi:asparagine synthetase B (glutamine-hydrolysing)